MGNFWRAFGLGLGFFAVTAYLFFPDKIAREISTHVLALGAWVAVLHTKPCDHKEKP